MAMDGNWSFMCGKYSVSMISEDVAIDKLALGETIFVQAVVPEKRRPCTAC